MYDYRPGVPPPWRPRPPSGEKAQKLLRASLDPQQLLDYDRYNYFTVRSNLGHLYRIECGNTRCNVRRLDRKGRPRSGIRQCAYLSGVPAADSHLAQKLILESDERRFLRTAQPVCLFYWGRRILLPIAVIGAALIILLK